MSVMVAAQLKSGVIFGDSLAREYVYMPGGEVGVPDPVCVLETADGRRDVSLEEAVQLVLRLHLAPARHPRLGKNSC